MMHERTIGNRHPVRRPPAARAGLAVLIPLLAAGLIGCSSGADKATTVAAASSGRPTTGGTPTAQPTAGGTPGHGTSSPGVRTITLDEHDKGTTVTVGVGTTIRFDLHSTYWSALRSSAPHVLAQVGTPSVTKGASCRPGTGCGTVQARFLARTAGATTVTAERSSCGEALACSPNDRTATFTIRVVNAN